MGLFKKEKQIGKIIREKLESFGGKALMPMLRGESVAIWISSTGKGIETSKLPNYILEWEHFDEIVKEANWLGGRMYRGDAQAQGGKRLGEGIPYDSMEGFIASELLYEQKGVSVTRRSTYYSGILAWAGIVALHRSQGKGSFITVNAMYRDR